MAAIRRSRKTCSAARNKGTCDNHLNGLRKHLMEPELLKEFCTELTKEVSSLRIERGADQEGWKRELERTHRELDKAIDAIFRAVPPLKL